MLLSNESSASISETARQIVRALLAYGPTGNVANGGGARRECASANGPC